MAQGALALPDDTGAVVFDAIVAALLRLATHGSGTSVPADIQAGEFFFDTDTPGTGVGTLYLWDGASLIALFTINTTTHAVVWQGLLGDLTAEALTAERFKVTSSNVVTLTGTSHSLADAHDGKVVVFTNGSAVALTVPSGLRAGFACTLVQKGAGQVTIGAVGGVTLDSRNGLKIAGQKGQAGLFYIGADYYSVGGDLAA